MRVLNLYHSLFIFHKTYVSIDRIMDRVRSVQDDVIRMKVSDNDVVDYANQLILEVSIFLDEYNSYWYQKAETDFRERIMQVRNICAPIMKALQQWSDIRDFRNRFVAHNWRDKKGKFVVPDLNIYNIPRNTFEYHMMADFVRYMYTCISFHFKNEIHEMVDYMYTRFHPRNDQTEYTLLNHELMEMAKDVNHRAVKYHSDFTLKIFLYEYEK